MNSRQQLLTLREVSTIYGLPLPTLRRWASDRRFPIYKISNRIRVNESEFRGWIEKFKINETKENKKNDKR